MQKIRKSSGRFLALLLSLLMLIGALPHGALTVFAADEKPALGLLEFQDTAGNIAELREDETHQYDYILTYQKKGTVQIKASPTNPEHNIWYVRFNILPVGSPVPLVKPLISNEWTKFLFSNTEDAKQYIVVGTQEPTIDKTDKKHQTIDLHEDVNTVYSMSSEIIASLENLAVAKYFNYQKTDLPISPAYSSDTYSYTAEVPYSCIELKLSPMPNASGIPVYIYANGAEAPFLTMTSNYEYGSSVYLTQDKSTWDDEGKLTLRINAGDGEHKTRDYTLILVRSDMPDISKQPLDGSVRVGDIPKPFTVDAAASGTLSYQWYKNTEKSNTGGVAITGADKSSYTPDVPQIEGTGKKLYEYYYCVVTNTKDEKEYSVASDAAAFTVVPDIGATLTLADGSAAEKSYTLFDSQPGPSFKVNVDKSIDNALGSFTYQWYSDSSAISGATLETYTPPTNTGHDAKIYKCQITYTVDGVSETYETPGCVMSTHFNSGEDPYIKTQPISKQELLLGEEPDRLYVQTALKRHYKFGSDMEYNKCFTYQWQKSSDGIQYTDIPGFTKSDIWGYQLADDVREPGTVYYRCGVVFTYTNKEKNVFTSQIVYSEPAVITVNKRKLELTGEGTAEHPFEIATQEDIVYLNNLVNNEKQDFNGTYFKMTADITLPADWTPLGTGDSYFAGHFDGGDNTLIVPDHGKPLFGNTIGTKVTNLILFGTHIDGFGLVNNYHVGVTASFDHVTIKSGTKIRESGFLGGFASGRNEIYITNCTIEPGVEIGYTRDHSNIGAFAGEFNGYIENCVSYADVYGKNYVGGIVANKGQTMGPFYIKNCTFGGTVTATGNFAGGIAGGGYAGTGFGLDSAPNTPCASVQNCAVTGTINGGDMVGGVFGGEPGVLECWSKPTDIGYIQANLFTGKISGTGKYVGGVVGYMKSMNRNNVLNDNFYSADCGASRGVGGIDLIDTNYENPDKSNPDVLYINTPTFHRTDDPIGADAAKVAAPIAADKLKDPQTLDKLNNAEGGLGNWVMGENGPQPGIGAYIKSLSLGGAYKNEFYLGDQLDLTGLIVTAEWSDGTFSQLSQDKVKIAGYAPDRLGEQSLIISSGAAKAILVVTVLNRPGADITVTFSLLGDDKHGDTDVPHTLSGGNLTEWIKPAKYTVSNNTTVKDLLDKVLAENKMTCVNPTGNYVESITRNGVTLGQLDNGGASGWMYTINNVHSDLGVKQQYLKDHDVIVFHYTDDYTKENAIGGDTQTSAQDIIVMINAIGDVTLSSGNAISAARTAYDALTEEQKALVTNYSLLVEAEKAYAELIKANEEFEKIYQSVGDYIASLGTPDVGSVGGEWMAIGLARSGRKVSAGYYENVVKYVKEHINDKEQLHRAKSTDNSRIILALTALGYDVTDVGGHNLLAGLTDMSYIKKQGINGPIWALIAFDSHNYEIPAGDVTRDALISEILNAQLADSGWSLSGDEADPDMTAMAIQALAPYYKTNAEVKAAVDKALDRLSVMQTSAGGYLSWGTLNSESCAQVIVALTALGIDPATDTRFIKNGCSVVDALLAFYIDGGFRHTMDGEINGMATEQGYYALVSYARLNENKTGLYNMSDVTLRIGENPEIPDDPSKNPDDNNPDDPSKNPGEDKPDNPNNKPDDSNPGNTSTKPNTGGDVQSPQTGDTSNVVVYFGLMLLSLAGLTVTTKRRKEKQD